MIHLTTHRLTFHASLLATRPDLASTRGGIKSGPAVFHKKGWRFKRRVWLELSHDMICAYASSKEGDRTRPICTLLCTCFSTSVLSSLTPSLVAFVKGVIPLDPKKPRIIKLVTESALKSVVEYTEFDTEESAHDWRRELIGTVLTFY